MAYCECWPRDGLQSWPEVISTSDKIAVLEAVVDAGVDEIDATSLVPARYAPQFADAREILEFLRDKDVRTRVLTPNVRGVERAIALRDELGGGITAIGFPISASEAHNIANLKKDHREQFAQIEQMIDLARRAGLQTVTAVATAYGCPIVGEVGEDAVFSIARRLVSLGVDRLMLSDTTGVADPIRVGAYTRRAREEFTDVGLIAHFHDTRGTGIANTWAAVAAGAHCVDACLGGIGGEPSTVDQNHVGETGNIAGEDIVVLLERAGVATGVDIDAFIAAGHVAETVQARPGRSLVQRTGSGIGVPRLASASDTHA